MINVSGEESKLLYSGIQKEGIYNPEGIGLQDMPGGSEAPDEVIAKSTEDQISLGKQLYSRTCFACHQAEGQGILGAFPPLANSDYLNQDVNRAIDVVIRGMSGEITVNGVNYNSVMTQQVLTDEEVANVLTYVYSSWGNSEKVVTSDMVKKVRNLK